MRIRKSFLKTLGIKFLGVPYRRFKPGTVVRHLPGKVRLYVYWPASKIFEKSIEEQRVSDQSGEEELWEVRDFYQFDHTGSPVYSLEQTTYCGVHGKASRHEALVVVSGDWLPNSVKTKVEAMKTGDTIGALFKIGASQYGLNAWRDMLTALAKSKIPDGVFSCGDVDLPRTKLRSGSLDERVRFYIGFQPQAEHAVGFRRFAEAIYCCSSNTITIHEERLVFGTQPYTRGFPPAMLCQAGTLRVNDKNGFGYLLDLASKSGWLISK